ncbi:MAG: ABC transporter ATP-binding protein [Bacteroidota bacterium]
MLETRDLSLTVAQRNLCARLNVRFEAGQNWVILGANGSGKTTLLHALAGLRAPDRGQVNLDGADIRALPHRQRARRVGLLFQDFETAFPATVLETVLSGRYPHLERWQWEGAEDYRLAEAALAQMELAGFSGRPLATLSGGERRRVEIAALLAQEAPIQLLDEPTNHLDLHHQVRVLEQLAALTRQPERLNVLVLHDVNLALRFGTHAILLFDDGEHQHGPAAEILQRPNLERLYHCSLREIHADGARWYLPI